MREGELCGLHSNCELIHQRLLPVIHQLTEPE